MIEDRPPEGALPVKQRRGRLTRNRLLSAGRRLIEERDIDSVSVADITRAADCSVGAFYLRFQDKDAFLRALIAQYVDEGRTSTLALFDTYHDDRLVGALVANCAERLRRSGGLIRSAIRKRLEDPGVWEPIRSNGHAIADGFVAWLTARRGRPPDGGEEIVIRFAFQMLYSALVNAVINQPGPLDLAEHAFLVQLERAFRLVLFSAGTPPALDAPTSRGRRRGRAASAALRYDG